MLSLPLIAPLNEYTLFLAPHLRHNLSDTQHAQRPQPHQPAHQNPHLHRRPSTSQAAPPSAPSRSSLAQLLADESAIAQRKHNIRHFGGAWIKPPGVAKTLLAEIEERAEREEQDALARREQVMLDLQAQQEREDARIRAEEAAAAEERAQGEGQEERDLDEDIPDADAEGEVEEETGYADVSSDAEEEEEEEEGTSAVGGEEGEGEGDVTFNDDSILEGSFMPGDEERDRAQQERYARLEEAELTGIAQDEADLGIERDLDGEVPEAEGYEHTDTELEDTMSDEEDEDEDEPSISERPSQRRISRRSTGGRSSQRSSLLWPQTQDGRQSLRGRALRFSGRGDGGSGRSLRSQDISSLLDSSFTASSPVMTRLRSNQNRGGESH